MKATCYFLLITLALFLSLNHSYGQAGCSAPTAGADLDISNVRAHILNGGDMWWALGNSNAKYEVPKGSGKHSLFAGSLWIGGLDPAGNVRVAAQTYRQSGSAFWPGPIDSLNAAQCLQYDRLWKINRSDVLNFIGGSPANADMNNYPGNGPGGQNNFLAPFFDKNNDGVYSTIDGDYPLFDHINSSTTCNSCGDCSTLHGDQAIWWVINDVGNANPLGNGENAGNVLFFLEIQSKYLKRAF